MLSHADVHGGASRAALRIHRALRKNGADCRFMVGKRLLDEAGIEGPGSRWRHRWSDARNYAALTLRLLHSTRNRSLHSYNVLPSGLASAINRLDIDVINIHWPHRELLSIAELGRIRHPVVWTLHDQWAFCGAEHYDDLQDGGRYQEGYRRRPDTPWLDLDGWTWRRKRRHWVGSRFHFVGPSRWMTECVKSSTLLADFPASTIPNCIDTDLFCPRDRNEARQRLDLSADRDYLLTVALGVDSDRRKGLHLLEPALQSLARNRDGLELLIVGADSPGNGGPDFGLPTRYLGRIGDEDALAWVYSAANVFVIPSLQENLPNTVVESLACGVPSAGFRIGGMTDLVEDGSTGALATPFDTDDLAQKIAWLLDNANDKDFAGAARQQALANHAEGKVAQRYLALFESHGRRDALPSDS